MSERIVNAFIHKYGRLPTERDTAYLEMLNMSKYEVLPAPTMKPGKCSNCGSSRVDGRGYVDIGLDLEWYGIFYICTLCLDDIAKNAGLYYQYMQQITKLTEQLENRDALDAKSIELKETVLHVFEEVKKHFADVSATASDSNSDSPSSVGLDETPSDDGTTTKTKSGSPEQASGTRRTDIPSLEELFKSI